MKCWRDYPELCDKEKLSEYLASGMYRTQICEKIGCTLYQLRHAVEMHDLNAPKNHMVLKVRCMQRRADEKRANKKKRVMKEE